MASLVCVGLLLAHSRRLRDETAKAVVFTDVIRGKATTSHQRMHTIVGAKCHKYQLSTVKLVEEFHYWAVWNRTGQGPLPFDLPTCRRLEVNDTPCDTETTDWHPVPCARKRAVSDAVAIRIGLTPK